MAPVSTVDRWAEVTALAGSTPCAEAPAALAEALAREPRDPEEVRVQVAAWHAARPDGLVRFADPAAVAGLNSVLAWSDWILDGELPAWVHLLTAVERCGEAELAAMMATHADRLCAQRGRAFAEPATSGPSWTPLPVLAAREAVAQVEAVRSLPSVQVDDLRRYFEAWILDGEARELPAIERGTRPLVALTRARLQPAWAILIEERAATAACVERAL